MRTRLAHRLRIALLAAAAALALPAAVRAAPPGWELRNGSWVPVVQPSPDTPEGQVAQMIHDLDDHHPKTVIASAKQWLKDNKANPLVPQVLLLYGDAEVTRGYKYRALYSYEDILNNFPTSELYNHVLQREYDIADAFLKGYKRMFLGLWILPVTEDALTILDRIQDRQRGSPLAERAGMRVADYYYDRGDFPEAIDSYSDFLKRYPYSQYVRKAEIRRAQASLANYRGVKFDTTPLVDARERLTGVQQMFPQAAQELQIKALTDRIYQMEGRNDLEIARYYWRAGQKYASAWYYRRVINNWPDTQVAQLARDELHARMPDKVSPPLPKAPLAPPAATVDKAGP